MSVAVLLAVCGCQAGGADSGDGQGGGTSPSTQTSSSDSAQQKARKEATEAYVGMWRNTAEASKTSDWRSPKLSKYAAGDALQVLSRSMYADHYNGLVSKGRPKNSPHVTSSKPSSRPTTVMISDCGDSTHWLKYRKKSGKLADDKPGGRRSITAEVKKQDSGVWKVTRFAVERIGSC